MLGATCLVLRAGAWRRCHRAPSTQHRAPSTQHYLLTHFNSSGKFGALPCISRPTRKMRPPAQMKSTRRRDQNRDRERDLPERRARRHHHAQHHRERRHRREERHARRRASIRARASRRTSRGTRACTSIIAGCSMLCASLRSEHAEPSARKIDPNISAAQTRNSRNQAMSTGLIRSGRPNRSSRVDRRRRSTPNASSSETPTTPRSLPDRSWNGVTEPSSTSLILLIFSSMIALSRCCALGHHRHEHQDQEEERHAEARRARPLPSLRRPCRPDCARTRPNVVERRPRRELRDERAIDAGLIEPALGDLLVERRAQPVGQPLVRGVLRVVVDLRPSSTGVEHVRPESRRTRTDSSSSPLRQLHLDVVGRAAGEIDPARQEVRARPGRRRCRPCGCGPPPPARCASYSTPVPSITANGRSSVSACRSA